MQLATPLGAAALENGQVSATLLNYYYTPGPLKTGAKVIATSNDKNIYTALAGTTFAPAKDLRDPATLAAIKDYLARTVKYNAWTKTHAAAVAQAYVKYLNLDPDTAKLEAESNVSQLVPITKQLLASEQSDADLFEQERRYCAPCGRQYRVHHAVQRSHRSVDCETRTAADRVRRGAAPYEYQ